MKPQPFDSDRRPARSLPAARLVSSLTRSGLIVTTVESCTGGALASAITDVPGASDVFLRAYVTYDDESKVRLGVPAALLKRYGPYSKPVALAMAKAGLRRCSRAALAISVTGALSRPDPRHPSAKVGTVFIAVARRSGRGRVSGTCVLLKLRDTRERPRAKARIVAAALRIALARL